MKRFIVILSLGIIFSCYIFPFGLSFLPESVNTKMVLALIGAILVIYNSARNRQLIISKYLLVGTCIAVIFSLVCYYSTIVNNTSDYTYATYFVSFFVWLGGAYTVCAAIRSHYGKVTFKLLTIYFTGVCVTQCILALLIDHIPSLKTFVDTYISQGQTFLNKINRLYGIGASLDPAGVRFCIVLIMIMALVSKDRTIRSNVKVSSILILSFFFISLIGNMISRTATVGMVIGLVYLIISLRMNRGGEVEKNYFNFYFTFGVLLLLVFIISAYLYNTTGYFHQHLRFAFEGFFNWMDTGVWRTDSTDKLNSTMWIWPSDTSGWVIGTGLFGNFVYKTDIGYCRFILYCGILGFSIFASFFVYNAYASYRILPSIYADFSIALLILCFAIWYKVSTDIFQIYALFYCMDAELKFKENRFLTEDKNENSISHSGDV